MAPPFFEKAKSGTCSRSAVNKAPSASTYPSVSATGEPTERVRISTSENKDLLSSSSSQDLWSARADEIANLALERPSKLKNRHPPTSASAKQQSTTSSVFVASTLRSNSSSRWAVRLGFPASAST